MSNQNRVQMCDVTTVVVGSNLHQVQNVNYIGYFTSHIVQ